MLARWRNRRATLRLRTLFCTNKKYKKVLPIYVIVLQQNIWRSVDASLDNVKSNQSTRVYQYLCVVCYATPSKAHVAPRLKSKASDFSWLLNNLLSCYLTSLPTLKPTLPNSFVIPRLLKISRVKVVLTKVRLTFMCTWLFAAHCKLRFFLFENDFSSNEEWCEDNLLLWTSNAKKNRANENTRKLMQKACCFLSSEARHWIIDE